MYKLVLLMFAVCCFAQMPVPNGLRCIVFSQPAAGPTAIELFWDAMNGHAGDSLLTRTVIAQFLNQLPPSTTNQQWITQLVLGLGGSSAFYIFTSSLSKSAFLGLDGQNLVISASPTVFNVTSMTQGFFTFVSDLTHVQVAASNLALTSNTAPTMQITAQPLVPGNNLQLWSFFGV
ncbi:hypothetical protein AURDEDRAFT_134184 [Auricularia subglabra TFB-10046 SS5]|nr:hypothetical protein AURDEDRAFT_134184 [Auricularia subglabra TFB-10046 SS5]